MEVIRMDNSLLKKEIDTEITCSNNDKNVVKIRHSLVDFVGMDEIGIESINEEEKRLKSAIWIYRKDLPKLIFELQKFV